MTERRPRGRRTAVVAVLVAGLVVALVVGAAALAWHELRPGDNTPAAASEPATFSDYADRLVDSTPGAWRATDDVVVVPDDAAGETSGSAIPAGRVGQQVPLPAHAFELEEQWLAPGADEQSGSDQTGTVLVDRGTAVLTCTTWPGTEGCTVSVGHLDGDDFVYDYGIGTESFQQPGAGIEVFPSRHYTSDGEETLVLAGGPAAASVVVVLADGSEVPATVTDAVGNPQGAVYFASTAGTPSRVIAYDAQGRVVEDHQLRDCEPGDSCEVR